MGIIINILPAVIFLEKLFEVLMSLLILHIFHLEDIWSLFILKQELDQRYLFDSHAIEKLIGFISRELLEIFSPHCLKNFWDLRDLMHRQQVRIIIVFIIELGIPQNILFALRIRVFLVELVDYHWLLYR